jgi:hypothetical protein
MPVPGPYVRQSGETASHTPAAFGQLGGMLGYPGRCPHKRRTAVPRPSTVLNGVRRTVPPATRPDTPRKPSASRPQYGRFSPARPESLADCRGRPPPRARPCRARLAAAMTDEESIAEYLRPFLAAQSIEN